MTEPSEPLENDSVLIGGPDRHDIILVPYDSGWPARFLIERSRIEAALGAGARRIEHIGSTAVPGLAAKPVIDLLLIVADAEDEPSYLPALERAGYVLRVREPGHRMLRTPELDVHVHVWADSAPAAEAYLTFRDRLRSDAGDRDRYAATKRRLASRDWPTVHHYARAKTDVIQQILAAAGPERSTR